MSVYTELNSAEISQLLNQYNLGEYRSHKGISAGVENTNYFVETSQQSLVLTLFEKHTPDELPFYLQLGEHLHKDHCKVPQPFRSNAGEFIQIVKDKPAVFVERLKGGHVNTNTTYANEIAAAMADVHLSTAHFSLSKPHSHNLPWVKKHAAQLLPCLNSVDQTLLNSSINLLNKLPENLPRGIIHADLFHDNALFENGHISGIIDWYFAGTDSYALDIAIAINDWCLDSQSTFDLVAGEQFIESYNARRHLSELETNAIPLLQIQSATRFWISRILAQREHKQSDDNITVKDPEQMKQLLTQLLSYA